MGRVYDIQPGDIFGRLTVIGKVDDAIDPKSQKHMSQFLCKCSCPEGNIVVVKAKNLVAGHTTSCGCILRENAAALHTGKPAVHPVYPPAEIVPNVLYAYYTMLYEAEHGIGQDYGKQIPVYGKWIRSNSQAENIGSFYNSMYSTYEPGYKLDRLDKSIGFRPDNCYWSSRSRSPKDRINDRFIEFKGTTLTVSEWNRALGYEPNTIRDRLIKGLSEEDAIMGNADNMAPKNGIYFVNEYGRPLNRMATAELAND